LKLYRCVEIYFLYLEKKIIIVVYPFWRRSIDSKF